MKIVRRTDLLGSNSPWFSVQTALAGSLVEFTPSALGRVRYRIGTTLTQAPLGSREENKTGIENKVPWLFLSDAAEIGVGGI